MANVGGTTNTYVAQSRNMMNICTKFEYNILMISGSYGGLLRHTTDNARIMAFKLPTGEVKIVYNTGFLRPFAAIQAIFTYKYFFSLLKVKKEVLTSRLSLHKPQWVPCAHKDFTFICLSIRFIIESYTNYLGLKLGCWMPS